VQLAARLSLKLRPELAHEGNFRLWRCVRNLLFWLDESEFGLSLPNSLLKRTTEKARVIGKNASLNMSSTESAKFFLSSICIHFALFWLLWQNGTVEYGAASSGKMSRSKSDVLTARLILDENLPVRVIHQTLNEIAPSTKTELPIQFSESANISEVAPQAVTYHDYLTVGNLTRLPEPITEIDLDVAGINDILISGKVELTVLINEAGMVVDVIPEVEVESEREFAEIVAQHFRSAHFTPGEINGRAVNSQLKITVVSEVLPTIDARK
jgi:hypothetical protein